MKIITFKQIRDLHIPPETCYQWAEEAIATKKDAVLPAKISMHPAEGAFCNIMPCMIRTHSSEQLWGGVKVVNRYPERVPSLDSKLLLLDMMRGEFLALMDANWITAMRTGAVAVHSIKYFAKKDFKTIAIMGLGNTARATLLMLVHQFPNKSFDIRLLRYKGQEELFINRFGMYTNLHFSCVNDAKDLISGADVVVSCVTYFENDFCSDEYFDKGVLVIPVHTRGFTNCDLFFDKVYADDYNHVKHFKNFNKFMFFAEVCDVVNGNAPGRKNEEERILVYNIGLSIHDINYASHIYQLLCDSPKLMGVDMQEPDEKFWI